MTCPATSAGLTALTAREKRNVPRYNWILPDASQSQPLEIDVGLRTVHEESHRALQHSRSQVTYASHEATQDETGYKKREDATVVRQPWIGRGRRYEFHQDCLSSRAKSQRAVGFTFVEHFVCVAPLVYVAYVPSTTSAILCRSSMHCARSVGIIRHLLHSVRGQRQHKESTSIHPWRLKRPPPISLHSRGCVKTPAER